MTEDESAESRGPEVGALGSGRAHGGTEPRQPGGLAGKLRVWKARHLGHYILALGDKNPDYIGGAFEEESPYNEVAAFGYLRKPKQSEVYKKLAAFPEAKLAVVWRYGRGAPSGRIVRHYDRPRR